MASHRIGARLSGLSPEQLVAFLDEQAPLWSAAALRVAEEHAARLAEQPEWILSEVLLSPDLAPHILAQLPTKEHALKGTCRAWRRGWKETLKKRDRPRVVVFGGCGSNNGVSLSSLERYDPSMNEWEGETVAPMLTARSCFGMAVLDGKLYVAGGRDEGDQTCNLVERYDFATNGWEVVAPMAVARNQPGVAVHDGKLYAVGGMDDTGDGGVPNRLSSTERYCPATDAWEMVAPMGSVRQSPAMAVLDGKMYAVGGYGIEEEEEEEEGNDGRNLSSVERYDPEMNAWEAVAPMGSSRDECGVAVLEDKLYAVGGEGSEPDSDVVNDTTLRSVIRYDLATNTWETVAPMSTERKRLGVTVLDGMLYAVGGENYERMADDDYEGPFMKSAERFNPATSAWEEVAPMAAARSSALALSM